MPTASERLMRPHGALDVDALLGALGAVLDGETPAAVHEPEFAGREWAYVRECLDTGWVSSVGRFVDRFEGELAEFAGARWAVATVNGTAALHVCLVLAGVRPGDEVIVPALTFVATANAVAYCGATPHIVDCDERSLGLDVEALAAHLEEFADLRESGCTNRQTGQRIAAVVPMHAFGHPVDMDPLLELAMRWKLAVVEDAAAALGSTYKGRHTGTFGLLGALSFNGNKIISTGGGGAVLTNDEGLARRARHLTTTARVAGRSEHYHDEVGYNYRLPNLNAALGCAQLELVSDFIADKRALAGAYAEALANVTGVRFFVEPDYARSNYWLNTLLLDDTAASARDRVFEATNAAGIATRPSWAPLHRLPPYRDCPRASLACTEDLAARIVNLPSSARLGRRFRKGGAAADAVADAAP